MSEARVVDRVLSAAGERAIAHYALACMDADLALSKAAGRQRMAARQGELDLCLADASANGGGRIGSLRTDRGASLGFGAG